MMENQYNNGKLNLESNDLMDKTEIQYNKLKGKLKFKWKSKVEDLILELKAEKEKLKSTTTDTKKNMLLWKRAVIGAARFPIG